jgi:hypothetical protein
MAIEIEPIPGEWYENIETHQTFRVIDVDETSDFIEIQYADGDIGELDRTAWEELDLEWIQPPENWTMPYDAIEQDDLGYTDIDIPTEEEEPKVIKKYENDND